MKLNKFALSFATLAAMVFASCESGQYWDEPSDLGVVYSFPKTAATVTVPQDGSYPASFEVTVSRNNSGDRVTIPVTFESKSDVLTGPAEVTFENGCNTTVYTINISKDAMPGVSYTATLAIDGNSESILHQNAANLKFTFTISQALSWGPAGTAATVSSFAGVETPVNIPVEEATNYPDKSVRLMRLVSPYWYLEPAYAEKGHDIQFLVTPEGDAISLSPSWQYIGETDSDGNYLFVGTNGGPFINQGDIFLIDGFIGYGATLAGPSALGWYETLMFQWSDYGK